MNGQGVANNIFKVTPSTVKPLGDDDASCTDGRKRDRELDRDREECRESQGIRPISKKRSKTRSKPRSKPRVKSRTTSLTASRPRPGAPSASAPSAGAPSAGMREAGSQDNDMDPDLNTILNDLENTDQRCMQSLSSIQKDIGVSVTFMLESISMGFSITIEAARSVVPEIHHARGTNRSAASQLRILDDVCRK